MVQPVIHHIEACVQDLCPTVLNLRRYGFRPFASRESAYCKQVALKLNKIVFILTEKRHEDGYRTGQIGKEPLTFLCSRCEKGNSSDHIDTVFNIVLNIKNVKKFFTRANEKLNCDFEKYIIQPPTMTEDEHGRIEYCVLKSICGNVIHVLLNKDDYKAFLPGFKMLDHADEVCENSIEISDINQTVTQIDHITLACHIGMSSKIIDFYKSSFGMEKFSISNDDKQDGLILQEGVGLRIRAMQYYRCSETGLICPVSKKNGEKRSPNSLMLVVVESLTGQKHCNLETFLLEHQGGGIEHIAFASRNILSSVCALKNMGVNFRLPPTCYYTELRKMRKIQEIPAINLDGISKYGILLDREEDSEGIDSENEPIKPKYLMQIFAMPLFQRKTFFIEIIERSGAIGLGSGNIIALVRSIREDEKRKAAQAGKSQTTKDEPIQRGIC